MKNIFVSAIVAVSVAGGVIAFAGAAPRVHVPPNAAIAKPVPGVALNDLEIAYVQIVALSQQLANCQASQLASVKQFTDVQKDALARIEKAHPGYTVDFSTGKLIAKVEPK